jgi:hypothetical protein
MFGLFYEKFKTTSNVTNSATNDCKLKGEFAELGLPSCLLKDLTR